MDRVGPYVIERKIGTGGMGTVYLASNEATGERVAVKVLPASLAREPGFLARFEREVDALRQLSNRHVVRIYESGTIDDVDPGDPDSKAYYYAMEYVDGETLLEKLRRDRRLPWLTAIDYAVQVCSALKAAHDAGIIHRDLKPSNLLVATDGTVKLADFGVAQVFASSRLTKTGGVVGTAEYMSPEQAAGARATKKSDLYSLGAVLYVMLTGKPPFSGNTMLDVLHKHRFGQFDRPRHFCPDCPSWLEEVVVQLLEKDPEKRPADAYVLSKRLKEIPKKVDLSRSEPLPAESAGPPTEQEVLSADDGVGGRGSSALGDAPTRTAPGLTSKDTPAPPRGPGEATLMHNLMQVELERQRQLTPVEKFFENTWVLVSLLALLILGGFVWYHWGPTPAEHWAAATAILERTASPDWTTAREEHLEPLLAAGGEWEDKARPLIDRVKAYEKRTAADRRAATRVGSTAMSPGPTTPAAAGNEADRLLRLARSHVAMGDTAAAARTLDALLVVTAGQPAYADQRTAAERLLADLRTDAAASKDRPRLIRAAIARAERLAADGDAEQARSIYRGLLTLYGDDPAAADLLAPARKALDGG